MSGEVQAFMSRDYLEVDVADEKVRQAQNIFEREDGELLVEFERLWSQITREVKVES